MQNQTSSVKEQNYKVPLQGSNSLKVLAPSPLPSTWWLQPFTLSTSSTYTRGGKMQEAVLGKSLIHQQLSFIKYSTVCTQRIAHLELAKQTLYTPTSFCNLPRAQPLHKARHAKHLINLNHTSTVSLNILKPSLNQLKPHALMQLQEFRIPAAGTWQRR